MGVIRKDFKYKLVKNFLTPEELKIGSYYYHLEHKKNLTLFDSYQNNNGDSYFSGDSFTETFMMRKLKKMEEETGLELLPTYGFTRFYTFNADLKKHTDRPSCEISVTVMWDSDGTAWPIFMDGTPVEMQKGDAIIYLGTEIEHWRENFKGDFHLQSFLHYVDKNGPYTEYEWDKKNIRENAKIL